MFPGCRRFSERHVLTHLTADLPCNVDHGIIGLMDPAHGPFVHQAWWWRGRHSIHEKEKHFEPIPEGFRMSAHAPSSNSAPYRLMRLAGMKPGDRLETTIDFVLPNRRYEVVRCGDAWFSTLTTVTPVTPGQVPHRRARGLEPVPLGDARSCSSWAATSGRSSCARTSARWSGRPRA